MGSLFPFRRGERLHREPARIQTFRQALDRAALAGGVPPFEQAEHGNLRPVHLKMQIAHLILDSRQLPAIFRLVQPELHVESFEHRFASLYFSTNGKPSLRARALASLLPRPARWLRSAFDADCAAAVRDTSKGFALRRSSSRCRQSVNV